MKIKNDNNKIELAATEDPILDNKMMDVKLTYLRRHLLVVAMWVISVLGGLALHLKEVKQTQLQEAPTLELP